MDARSDVQLPGDREFRFRIGLRPVEPSRWLDIDELRAPELQLKDELMAQRHGEVIASLPDTEAAAAELRDAVLAELADRRLVEVTGERVTEQTTGRVIDLAAMHPIEAAGRLVQEDWCLMAPSPQGHRLVAASLCFPGRWRLADKIGRPMAAIHAPVPRYDSDVGPGTDRVLAGMSPGRIVERFNWSVMDDSTLFQPTGHGAAPAPPDAVGEQIVLRTERQTLRGFSDGVVAFGIRTRVRRLAELTDSPQVCGELADSIRRLPPEVAAYKSLGTMRDAVVSWLDVVAAG